MTRLILAASLVLTPAPVAPKEVPQWQPIRSSSVSANSVAVISMTEYSSFPSWIDPPEAPSISSIAESAPPPSTVPIPSPTVTAPPTLSDAQLYRLRMCESTDDYGAHLVWGTQWESRATGAYQFEQPTWDGVAAQHMPWLVGVRPHLAWPAEQDAMTRWLWSERGRYPWPVCGLRVGAP